jgi:hypothetical protein
MAILLLSAHKNVCYTESEMNYRMKINLCSGTVRIPGSINVDILLG